MIKEFINEILEKDKEIIVKIEEFPERKAEFSEFKFENELINRNLKFKLYKHQVDALRYLYEGKNVVITTPTASGKSEIFRLYIFDKYLSKNDSRFLLIFPTRALLYDQLEKFLERKKEYGIKIKEGILLGDLTSDEKRKIIKEKPNVLFTTPDTLHLFILKNHHDFSWLFKKLSLIVIDELHSYKGVFGTNAAYVFRRLIRLLEIYYKNKNYRILCLSATLRNPKKFAEMLIGKKFESIENSYHQSPKKYLIVIDPSEKYNTFQYLKILTEDLLKHNIKSLVFLETKRSVEKMRIMFDIDLIGSYKGSYTRERRREIERKFKEGNIKILFTTSALELGIDIGDVTCVLNYGVPPDGLFSLIQRFGRAARIKEGLNILILRNDALDAYYKENVNELLNRIKKNLIDEIPVNLSNKFVVKKHLKYLIKELGSVPLSILNEYEKEVLKELEKEGEVKIVKNWFTNEEEVVLNKKDIRYTGIRNISEDTYFLLLYDKRYIKAISRAKNLYRLIQFFKSKGIIFEEVDRTIFYDQLLPGMIYFSYGNQYRVVEFKRYGNFNFVFLEKINSSFPLETKPIFREDVEIEEVYDEKSFRNLDIFIGKLKIKRYYEGYILKAIKKEKDEYTFTGEIHYYDNPYIYKFETKGIWILIKDVKDIEREEFDMFYKKLLKYDKEKGLNISEYVKYFVNTVDKEEYYNRYRGATSKKIKEIIENFLKSKGIDPEKNKKLVFYIKKIIDSYYAFKSGLHAIEHNLIKISPTVTNVDSRELGGYSYEYYKSESEFSNKPLIFIYEAYENGVGLSEILFENIENLLKKSYERLRKCKCIDGCPKCILSTKCGNSNEFLDRYAAILIYRKIFK